MKIITNLIEAHIIRFKNNKIQYLLLKRSENEKYPNIWQMVTGKIKSGEEAYKTAIREISEETNIEIKNLYIVPNVNSFYNSENDSINFIPVFVTVVKNKLKVVISNEHNTFKWVSKKRAKKLLAWPGQMKSVNIINDFFSNKNNKLNFIKIDLTNKG